VAFSVAFWSLFEPFSVNLSDISSRQKSAGRLAAVSLKKAGWQPLVSSGLLCRPFLIPMQPQEIKMKPHSLGDPEGGRA